MNDIKTASDEKVVEIVRTKDKEVYSEIIRRYQAKLMRYAGYLLGDEHQGADAVQQGFIKAYINLNGFDVKRKFSSWLYRIVHNEAMNMLNKQKRVVSVDDQQELDSGIQIEDAAIKQELVNHTHYCLEQMEIIYKEPLSLFYLEEKSYEEISDILRLPMGTVGTRINRAKVIMKKICQRKT
ncbi:MAG: sigma-70 family RNA polymerase sigma factor [Candidatus Roizmanbacteria bacterium]|nr:sigma-70 family RNA polymerase sigma factor [Candidatus Roizmanbacteria bacterium]